MTWNVFVFHWLTGLCWSARYWPTSTEKFRTDIIMAINIPMIYGYGRAARQSRRMVDRGERRFGLVWRFVAKSWRLAAATRHLNWIWICLRISFQLNNMVDDRWCGRPLVIINNMYLQYVARGSACREYNNSQRYIHKPRYARRWTMLQQWGDTEPLIDWLTDSL